jgi:hypothetical protein
MPPQRLYDFQPLKSAIKTRVSRVQKKRNIGAGTESEDCIGSCAAHSASRPKTWKVGFRNGKEKKLNEG